MEIFSQSFIQEINTLLKINKIPLEAYNTINSHELRLRRVLSNGKKETIRYKNSNRYISGRFAVFYIYKALKKHGIDI